MSVEAMSWVLNEAKVERSSAKFVLLGLANHAGKYGEHAFPSVATLVTYTGLSERSVRMQLDWLEEEGWIRRCDQGIVRAHIDRADRRPVGFDLVMDRPVDSPSDEVQDVHPAPERGATDAPTGCNSRADGVQLMHERGAAVAPEPSMNHPEPSIDPRPIASTPVDGRTDEDPRISEALALIANQRLAARPNAPTDLVKRRRYLATTVRNMRAEEHLDATLADLLAEHPWLCDAELAALHTTGALPRALPDPSCPSCAGEGHVYDETTNTVDTCPCTTRKGAA